MPELDAATQRRNQIARRFLAALWVVWAVWLVTRPIETTSTTITRDARTQLAIMAFAIVFFVSYGLLREWRWPVVASRALVAALVLGVAIGPQGRDAWVFAVDIVFAVVGFVVAFLVIKQGVAPPPKRSSEMVQRRMERKRDQIRRTKR